MAWAIVYLCLSVTLLFAAAVVQHQLKITTTAKVISGNGSECPLEEARRVAVGEINNDVFGILQLPEFVFSLPNQCGEGLWYRVAYLNTSDATEQCPLAWSEFTSNGIRTCARPTSDRGSCPGINYSTSRQYSKVCGRIIGYQIGSADSFAMDMIVTNPQSTINDAYLDGVSVTRGDPRIHIWSYVGGANENGSCTDIKCPCSGGIQAPPPFVGTNYYCESAYQGDCYLNGEFFPGDPLWDGQQCENEGTCCTGHGDNSPGPPWFRVDLPSTVMDHIEVRICHNQRTGDEDTPIQLLELYVQ